jgi:protein phosphatase
MRWSKGNNVQLLHGLDKTVKSLEQEGVSKEEILEFFKSTPYYLRLDDGKLIVVHAAFKPSMLTRDPFHKRNRTWALYGPTTGKTLDSGLPDRIDWAIDRKVIPGSALIVYGHQPHREPRIVNRTYGIDTGCVFGGHLTCLRYPEMELVQVKASHVYDNSKPDISG